MKLPVEHILKKGLVLVLNYQFPDQKKPKYVVVLNKTNFTEVVLLLLPTTQIKKYETKFQHAHHFRLTKDQSACFNKDNIFDFDNIQKMPYADFKALYENEFIGYKGCLEDHILSKVDEYIDKCRTLEKYFKRMIL